MKGAPLGIVIAVFFLLQVLVVDKMEIGRIGPDFPLLIVVYLAVFKGPIRGSTVGFLVGLIQDLFNPALLGLNALTKTLAGYVLGVTGAKTEPESSVLLFALFGGAALAHDAGYLLLFTGLNLGKFFLMWAKVSVPSAVYTAIIGVLVHSIVSFALTEVVRYLGKTRSQG
jgi:rod shape-determining protein MreD